MTSPVIIAAGMSVAGTLLGTAGLSYGVEILRRKSERQHVKDEHLRASLTQLQEGLAALSIAQGEMYSMLSEPLLLAALPAGMHAVAAFNEAQVRVEQPRARIPDAALREQAARYREACNAFAEDARTLRHRPGPLTESDREPFDARNASLDVEYMAVNERVGEAIRATFH